MSAKTDRELLELAAKAAGITLTPVEVKNVEFQGDDRWIGYMTDSSQWSRGWFSPLTDDGDALRLAVRLDLLIDVDGAQSEAGPVGFGWIHKPHDSDPYAATRRAIVRAAAVIGETL